MEWAEWAPLGPHSRATRNERKICRAVIHRQNPRACAKQMSAMSMSAFTQAVPVSEEATLSDCEGCEITTEQQIAAMIIKKKTLDALACELLMAILHFLPPESILAMEIQSKRWRSAAISHESLWLPYCTKVWKDTGFLPQWVPPTLPLLQRIRNVCSIAQMRRALASFETTALLEKADFIRLNRSKLLFGIAACTRGPRGGYVPPAWCCELNDGKAAWVYAKRESKRKACIESELLLGGGKWDLYYKQSMDDPYEVTFFANKEMTASSHAQARFAWHLNTAPGFEGVQVESFPLHVFSRDASGSWALENSHVIMRQRKGDWDPEMLPLL